jgi:DNA polymerase III subunit gamma/tau
MAYVASALAYRPKRFKDYLGQEATRLVVQRAITLNRIPNVYLITGQKGCLDGDTHIDFHVYDEAGAPVSHKGGRIQTLYQRFHRLPQKTSGSRQAVGNYRAVSMDDEGNLILNDIEDVIFSGEKECFRLKTKGGKTIQATADHEFFTGSGYTRLDQIEPGDLVYTAGRRTAKGRKLLPYRKEVRVENHPYARRKNVEGHQYLYLREYRAAYEAGVNGIDLTTYLERLGRGDLAGLWFLPPDFDVHHRDENWKNNDFSNLEMISHSEHAARHGRETRGRSLLRVAVPDTVATIESVGVRKTYDVRMADPYRNFLADGVIVHNCGKTSMARLIAKALVCDDVPRQRAQKELVDPCGECDHCMAVHLGKSDLVTEVDAASHGGVDDVREFESIAKQVPHPGKARVLIIDEAHQLTVQAQNALLVLFENPPPGFLPILCTTDAQKILPTIKSRCSALLVRPFRGEVITTSIARIFADVQQPITADALALLSRQGQGSLRDVQQLADQLINAAGGVEINETFIEGAVGIPTSRMYILLARAISQTFFDDGFIAWVNFLQHWFAEGFQAHDLFFTMIPIFLRDCAIAQALIELGQEPEVEYMSGITHETFREKLTFTKRDLDIMQEAWEMYSKHFGMHGMIDKIVVEMWMMQVMNVRRFEAA